VRGLYFYLVMDIFSRKTVGWSLHETEPSEQAANLMRKTCLDEKIKEGGCYL
jgi:putative transposase